MSRRKLLIGLFGFALLGVGACYAIAEGRLACSNDASMYEVDRTCRPGGELATVTHVVDGDTVELDDGRTVRLLGVDAPEADSCAGPGATWLTRSLVEDKVVVLHRETWIGLDRNGHTLGYIRYGGPYFTEDLGHELVLQGWALRSDDDAQYMYDANYADFMNDGNSTYMRAIESAAGIAQYRSSGVYQQPCGVPRIYGDKNGDGVADFDVYGGFPDVNLPDGALTGGYCASRWWC